MEGFDDLIVDPVVVCKIELKPFRSAATAQWMVTRDYPGAGGWDRVIIGGLDFGSRMVVRRGES